MNYNTKIQNIYNTLIDFYNKSLQNNFNPNMININNLKREFKNKYNTGLNIQFHDLYELNNIAKIYYHNKENFDLYDMDPVKFYYWFKSKYPKIFEIEIHTNMNNIEIFTDLYYYLPCLNLDDFFKKLLKYEFPPKNIYESELYTYLYNHYYNRFNITSNLLEEVNKFYKSNIVLTKGIIIINKRIISLYESADYWYDYLKNFNIKKNIVISTIESKHDINKYKTISYNDEKNLIPSGTDYHFLKLENMVKLPNSNIFYDIDPILESEFISNFPNINKIEGNIFLKNLKNQPMVIICSDKTKLIPYLKYNIIFIYYNPIFSYTWTDKYLKNNHNFLYCDGMDSFTICEEDYFYSKNISELRYYIGLFNKNPEYMNMSLINFDKKIDLLKKKIMDDFLI